MRFQQRDESILKTIQSYDGILARRQIKEMFWEDASNQAMERRLSLYYFTTIISIGRMLNSAEHGLFPNL